MSEDIKLYELLTRGSMEEIEKNLLNEIYNVASFCSDTIGEGAFGKITVPAVGPYLSVKLGDDHVLLPIVIKETKLNGSIFIDIYEKNLILSSYGNLTCEALILFVLSKGWYKGLNLHLPFLMGMGSCDNQISGVTHIILEKCGLPENIVLANSEDYFGNPFHLGSRASNTKITNISTVGQLLDYFSFRTDKNLNCIIPNNKIVYTPEIIDTICIFYLHTTYYLWEKYGLVLGDQHIDNVFIQWISKNSRCGKKSLDKLEMISYSVGKNKCINVNTHGMIFRIGDIGVSIMNIQKNVMIVGNLIDSNKIKDVLKYKNKCNCYWDFIFNLSSLCPLNIFNKTIISKIMKKHNIFTKYVAFFGVKEKYKNNFPTEIDILNDELYVKVDIKEETNNMFVVNM
jgi:hypothetical protein